MKNIKLLKTFTLVSLSLLLVSCGSSDDDNENEVINPLVNQQQFQNPFFNQGQNQFFGNTSLNQFPFRMCGTILGGNFFQPFGQSSTFGITSGLNAQFNQGFVPGNQACAYSYSQFGTNFNNRVDFFGPRY